jgi:PRTRC genetic system protein C
MADEKLIKYGDRTMPLEPGMTLEQAKELMARHFPELADPAIATKKDEKTGTTTYTFSKKAGHKG